VTLTGKTITIYNSEKGSCMRDLFGHAFELINCSFELPLGNREQNYGTIIAQAAVSEIIGHYPAQAGTLQKYRTMLLATELQASHFGHNSS